MSDSSAASLSPRAAAAEGAGTEGDEGPKPNMCSRAFEVIVRAMAFVVVIVVVVGWLFFLPGECVFVDLRFCDRADKAGLKIGKRNENFCHSFRY